ncbi:MAG: calcium-binding protein [Afipia sp.]
MTDAKIYIARKELSGPYDHSYFVYDPDGNPNSGDERIIRGGTTRMDGALSGPYLIEIDRPIAQSRDALGVDREITDPDDDVFSDRYYTTVVSDTPLAVQAIWEQMVDVAKSFGTENVDPWSGDGKVSIPADTPAYILNEQNYSGLLDNCNTLTRTIGDSVGIDVMSNLPKIGGDLGTGERVEAWRFIGAEAQFLSDGDGTTALNPDLMAYFDQGGADNYTLDPAALGPGQSIDIFEDSDTGTVDKITLQNVDPGDISIIRTPHGELLIYLAGRDLPIIQVRDQFDGSGVPKINMIVVEPPVGSPTSVPVIDPDNIPIYAPAALPSLVAGEIQPAFASAISAASPLVIDLSTGHTGVTLSTWSASSTETFFDLNDNGFAVQTAWVSGDTGLLARDLNSNGLIDSSAELFGSPTVDGFAKLAALDSNHDLRIDNNDAAWSTLVVWTDDNGDAVTQSGELHSLASLGIANIDLAGVASSTSTISGNPISHTSKVTFTGGATATIADAWFVHDNTNSYYAGDYTLDAETLFLPTLRGYGTLPDLTIAMSQDSDLKDLVADFVSEFTLADLANINADVDDILFAWADVDGVSPTSRGHYVDARHLGFLERIMGTEFVQAISGLSDPRPEAASDLEYAYEVLRDRLATALAVQSGASALFDVPVAYDATSDSYSGDKALSEDAIAGLTAIAPVSDPDNTAFWVSIANLIDDVKGLDNLTVDETSWLDDAVIASNALIDWTDVTNSYNNTVGTTSTNLTDGDDTVSVGATHDTIYAMMGNDNVHGNAGNDTIHGNQGTDTLYGDAGDDSLYGDDGDDIIYGGTGNDVLRGGQGNDLIYGGDGNNIMYGEYGNDTYYSGPDGNTIYSQNGADTFIYGGGHDVIADTGGTDQIVLPSGIALGDLHFSRIQTPNTSNNFHDLLIEIDGAGSIQISNAFSSSGLGAGKIESVIFADLSTLDLTTIANPTVYLSAGNDSFTSSATGDWTVYGGDGNDYIYNYQSGSHTFDGGNGNDTLRGGSGSDTYIASAGFDIIQENNGSDTIVVPMGFTLDDVTFYRVRNSGGSLTSDLGISIKGLGEIDVQLHFGSAPVEFMHFLQDSSTISLTTLSIITAGTSGNDSLSPPSANAGSNDIFDGREGDDNLSGGAGNDTYIFSAGHDKISDSAGDDTIRVRDSYSPDDITIAWNFDTLDLNSFRGFILTDIDGNSIVAQNQSYNAANIIEHVAFADGTIWNLNSMELSLYGTSGNDSISGRDIGDASSNDTIYGLGGNDGINGGNGDDLIYGGDGNDTIYGNAGADIIYGGDGADTITTSSNDGNDTVYGEAGADTLKGADHAVLYGGDGDDILMNIATSGYSATTAVEMYGGNGADTLSGLYGLTYMNGGAGADTLQGYVQGIDTFAFDAATAFDAVDTISNFTKTGTKADKIDISDVLDGHYDPLSQAITDFVQITTNGSNSELYVDTAGSATFGSAQHIATIQGVTGLTDEEALVIAGTLLAA